MADHQNRFFHRKKIMTIFFVCAAVLCGLLGRLLYLMEWRGEWNRGEVPKTAVREGDDHREEGEDWGGCKRRAAGAEYGQVGSSGYSFYGTS